ncbi:putative P-loop containing nucleoside triphosphate hydrolase, leucine-rich repeat domain, L [Rosa chinensis]|uniref:Putative P-loop containing nucleoside triphosphate hydrolase, leucine-rich repeat domain, L n=1 Tax=Rosa chinensis TaxID=74649 RepID=A0A2P6R042_ROSCH|nr:putative P-loop containing nucleoside triphosphate hydrolase, leucine-rich repeat domain, L [Rosa chinensis]
MAEAVVSFVVERIGDFIIQEGKFLYGVWDQVELAQTELQFTKGFLKDADARQGDNETVRICVAKIREAAYDLEDVIEIYALKVACKREGGIKSVLKRFGCMLKEGVDLHKIGGEIGVITTNIYDLRLRLQTNNIRELRESTTQGVTSVYERQQQLRRTYSHIIDRDVVGLEESVRELAVHLVKSGDRHRVVSICGMGGLGKTTLAKQVYHDSEVRQHFDSFAWVCISQRCQVRDVWEDILIKVSALQREEIAKLKDGEIAKKLYLVQQESKCLVVIDDIWSVGTWDTLKAAFPLCEETKSRILLTTRKEEVALHSDRNGFLFRPRPLNDDESWQLLEKIAISGRDEINSGISTRKKDLAKKMLQYCAGLPLAITVLAGLLARKDTVDEWDMVYKNVHTYIGRGKGHEQECSGASWVLALSYDDLPYHLKPCFLYLGNFPEDSDIPVKKLTQLWIAEGFISASHETMEDAAYGYLTELVERCVVQIGEQGSVRKIKSCHLHDLMRDMCLEKAKEENFLQNVNFSHQNRTSVSSSMVTNATATVKVRRLAIYLNSNVDELVPLRNHKDSHLRSLLYFAPVNCILKDEKLVGSLVKNFRLLRVLKFEGMVTSGELPNEIGNMVHLRFLSLWCTQVTRLPSSLGKLICLQTLNLKFCDCNVIPNVIWKMEQLRHLYLPSNLRKLGIRVTTSLEKLEEILKSISSTLDGIRSLHVFSWLGTNSGTEVTQIVSSCRHIYKLVLNGRTVELPNDLHDFPNLTKITLVHCDLKDNQMAVLEKLPNLKTLCLMEETFEYKNTKTLVFSKGGFPHLECLSLICIREAEDLEVEEGAMPRLRRLYITRCRKLKTIPDGLRYVTSLKKLTVAMPRSFVSRLQVGGEDYYKIEHVPSVVLTRKSNRSGRQRSNWISNSKIDEGGDSREEWLSADPDRDSPVRIESPMQSAENEAHNWQEPRRVVGNWARGSESRENDDVGVESVYAGCSRYMRCLPMLTLEDLKRYGDKRRGIQAENVQCYPEASQGVLVSLAFLLSFLFFFFCLLF